MNNDRFKFRVWDKKTSQFIPEERMNEYNPDDDCYELSGFFVDFTGQLVVYNPHYELHDTADNRYIIQQCTGLKDFNGNLTYEGDILKLIYSYPNDDGELEILLCKVYYDSMACSFLLEDLMDGGVSSLCDLPDYTEIIGNIFENPELLEEDV